MIPKTFHFVWVGDESRRPDNCIDTWRLHHPDWEVKVWGNAELHGLAWLNHRHMLEMYEHELCGVADLMRWEILYAFGGVALDADSVCLRRLDDALLDCPAFACWESEVTRPGMIANGYVGAEPQNPFIGQIVTDLADTPSVVTDRAWVTTGPLRLSESYRKYAYTPLRIYPSHYFIPRHQTGLVYQGADPVYADQLWGSTFGTYDTMHTIGREPEVAAAA
jgi:mannosyltransferase OCH1-like enzyme